MIASPSFSYESSVEVAGCPPMITRGTIVGETEGVERVEEAGDTMSSSDSDRSGVEGDNAGLAVDGDEV